MAYWIIAALPILFFGSITLIPRFALWGVLFVWVLGILLLRNVLAAVALAFLYRLGLYGKKEAEDDLRREKEESTRKAARASRKRVAVVGAGSSGLTAIKNLLEEGHEVVAYEALDHIGGNWAFSDNDAHNSVYETITINSSKENMCFSDFPPAANTPHFMNHKQVLKYFEDYCDHFHLREHIRFNRKVVSLVPRADGGWRVTTAATGANEGGGEPTSIEDFDAVLVANGHHWNPNIPKFTGEENFQGTIIHSHHYKRASIFSGKSVVVVGVGNSGCDIAVDASRVVDAEGVYLSTRRGCVVAPKYLFGRAIDHVFVTRLWHSLPEIVQQLLAYGLVSLVQGSPARYGLWPKELKYAHPTVNQDLLSRIAAGNIKVKPDVARLEAPNKVVFEDGSSVNADILVKATGYNITFPFLEDSVFTVKNNKVGLYRFVVPPRIKNLFFIGLLQPLGAIMPLAEIQARWVARILSGECSLPLQAEMEATVASLSEKMAKQYIQSQRHTVQTVWFPYIDELAGEIGVRPKVWRHWDLLGPLLFGIVSPIHYRLEGPGKWDGAAKAVKEMYEGTKTNLH